MADVTNFSRLSWRYVSIECLKYILYKWLDELEIKNAFTLTRLYRVEKLATKRFLCTNNNLHLQYIYIVLDDLCVRREFKWTVNRLDVVCYNLLRIRMHIHINFIMSSIFLNVGTVLSSYDFRILINTLRNFIELIIQIASSHTVVRIIMKLKIIKMYCCEFPIACVSAKCRTHITPGDIAIKNSRMSLFL